MFAKTPQIKQSSPDRSAARRRHRVQLSLFTLDARDVPTTLTPYSGWGPAPTATLAPSPLRSVALPSPTTLVGKSVELLDSGDRTGTLTITSLTLQSDGSFTLGGTFEANTETPSRTFRDSIPVVGYITAPQTGGPLITTASIRFHGQVANMLFGYTHYVEYVGTLSQSWNDAWTSGQVDAFVEFNFGFVGPGRRAVNGTFR